jgi:uncharacterized protein with HEPN domain
MNKYEEVLKRLNNSVYLTDIINSMSLARKWYDSGEISYDDFANLQNIGETMKNKWPN